MCVTMHLSPPVQPILPPSLSLFLSLVPSSNPPLPSPVDDDSEEEDDDKKPAVETTYELHVLSLCVEERDEGARRGAQAVVRLCSREEEEGGRGQPLVAAVPLSQVRP